MDAISEYGATVAKFFQSHLDLDQTSFWGMFFLRTVHLLIV
jgi:hypothetical protein